MGISDGWRAHKKKLGFANQLVSKLQFVAVQQETVAGGISGKSGQYTVRFYYVVQKKDIF